MEEVINIVGETALPNGVGGLEEEDPDDDQNPSLDCQGHIKRAIPAKGTLTGKMPQCSVSLRVAFKK